MKNLVFLEPNKIDSEPFTTSDVIAECAGIQHHTVTRLIQQHEKDFKEFGILRFKIEEIKCRGKPKQLIICHQTKSRRSASYKAKLECCSKWAWTMSRLKRCS